MKYPTTKNCITLLLPDTKSFPNHKLTRWGPKKSNIKNGGPENVINSLNVFIVIFFVLSGECSEDETAGKRAEEIEDGIMVVLDIKS